MTAASQIQCKTGPEKLTKGPEETFESTVNELQRYVIKSQIPHKAFKTGLFIYKCMKLNTETLLKYCILQIFNPINSV